MVAITVVNLETVQLPTKLAYWRNSAWTSPLITLFIHLSKSGPVVTFYPTRLFWITPTKMIHSSGVPESKLRISMMYFPEVVSLEILWHIWSIYSKASSSSFFCLTRGMIGLTYYLGWYFIFLGYLSLNFNHFVCLVNFVICREVTFLCPMLKTGRCKT